MPKKLKGTGIYLNEDLCQASMEAKKKQLLFLKKARGEGKIASNSGSAGLGRGEESSGGVMRTAAVLSIPPGSCHKSPASVSRRQKGPLRGGVLAPAAGSSGEVFIAVASAGGARSAASSSKASAVTAAATSAGAGDGDIGGAGSLPSRDGRVESSSVTSRRTPQSPKKSLRSYIHQEEVDK